MGAGKSLVVFLLMASIAHAEDLPDRISPSLVEMQARILHNKLHEGGILAVVAATQHCYALFPNDRVVLSSCLLLDMAASRLDQDMNSQMGASIDGSVPYLSRDSRIIRQNYYANLIFGPKADLAFGSNRDDAMLHSMMAFYYGNAIQKVEDAAP